MKKIIATVLAMVMALALCTTAFAAADKYDLYLADSNNISGGKLTIQEGSLYPILYRLQDQGLISEERVLVGKRMTRNYYHLEPSGVERLREMTAEYEELTAGVFAIIHREETIS